MAQKKVLLWMPLPKSSSWRGEGIAQVIERIIQNTPDIAWTLVLGEGAIAEAAQALKDCDNVVFLPANFNTQNVKSTRFVTVDVGFPELGKQHVNTVSEYITSTGIYQKIQRLVSLARWRTGLLVSEIRARRSFFQKFDFVWIPSPIVPVFKGISDDQLVVSFWDPFVFEYGSFGHATKIFFYRLLSLSLPRARKVMTQSQANKDYLCKIMETQEDKVHLLPLATGEMKSLATDEMRAAKETRDYVKAWPKRQYSFFSKKNLPDTIDFSSVPRSNRARVRNQFVLELNNKSAILRLQKRVTHDSKIFLISTQNRPYKGTRNLFLALEQIIRKHPNYYFIFTGDVGSEIKRAPQVHENVIELSRVTNPQLAFLYSIADLAIHPSYVEGGLGSAPQFEASSVGTPCLVNYGRHIAEAERYFGVDQSAFSHDFSDIHGTVSKILEIVESDEIARKNVELIQQCQISWTDVGQRFMQILES